MAGTMKRPHQLPRRFLRYEVPGSMLEKLTKLSPRQRWIAEQSALRWERNHNAGQKKQLLRGELGTWQGFRVITSDMPKGAP